MPNPACSMSQAAETLTRPSAAGQRGAASGQAGRRPGREDRVGEERARAPGVVVVGVQDHALAAAQVEHGGADVGGRHPVADLDAEAAGQLGVPDRCAEPGVLQGERDGEHDVPLRPLEDAVPVGELALRAARAARRRRWCGPARAPSRRSGRSPGRRRRCSGWGPRRPGRGCRRAPRCRRTPRSTASATTWSQSTPASTCRACAASGADAKPRVATCSTVPSKPSSATTRLLPPPRTSSGSSRASASRTRRRPPPSVSATTSRRAGPPRRRVVSPASGTSLRSSTPLRQDDDGLGAAEHLRAG